MRRCVSDEDPLPSFEKRQALAKELEMTPRSVQIWFQNRRQRLLKPMRQGECDSDDVAPYNLFTALAPNGDYETRTSPQQQGDIDQHSEQKEHEQEKQLSPLGNQSLSPLLRGDAVPQAAQVAMWCGISNNALLGWKDDVSLHTLSFLPQAVASGHMSCGAAVMLMQALQQQMDAHSQRSPNNGQNTQPASVSKGSSPNNFCSGQNTTSDLYPTPPTAKVAAAAPTTSTTQLKVREGVDGLLLLSACADFQMQDSLDNRWQCHMASTAQNTCSSMIMA